MLKPQNGYINLCAYCGEQVGNSVKYCAEHRTQKGRKATFDANAEIMRERKEKGLSYITTLKSWK